MTGDAVDTVLELSDWRERARVHRARAERWTKPARERKARGVPHPIDDFLFRYYPFPLSLLEHWHPGAGVALEWPDEAGPLPASGGICARLYERRDKRVRADVSRIPEAERQRLRWMRELLVATRDRAPNFACHGLHEWAMVYRGLDVRHAETTPLRLPQRAIDALVESRPICCSHFDAFRFFAKDARPLNRLQPTLDGRDLLEQPACIHANMDLYKWAAKAMPWIGSELLLDCFELAVELRDLDMRASPYDLAAWGREPVKIETPEGRRQYEMEQRALAEKAAPLRQRLIGALAAVSES